VATASLSIGANTGRGLREYVAAGLNVLDDMEIDYELTPMSTNLEGDVDTICTALAAIHARCHRLGAPRVESLLKIDDRIDAEQTLASKIRHVIEFRTGESRKVHR
jgi:uncharacterized protein (TIGR00106 family)